MTSVGNSILKLYRDINQEWGFEGYNKTYWPYQCTLTEVQGLKSAERWCYTNFKSCNWRNVGRYFAFKRKEDYEWFVLRWS